jgi:hypothetical protein
MPGSALENVDVDHRLPLTEIAPLLARLSREEVSGEQEGAQRTVPEDMEFASKVAGLGPAGAVGSDYQIGELSQLTCPDCSGPIYEIRDGKLLRYRCRVGHAYTAENILEEKGEALENALYVALNALEESALTSMYTRCPGTREQTRPRGVALRGTCPKDRGAGGPDPAGVERGSAGSVGRDRLILRRPNPASPRFGAQHCYPDTLFPEDGSGPATEKGSAPGMGGKVGKKAPIPETVANILSNVLREKALHTYMQFRSAPSRGSRAYLSARIPLKTTSAAPSARASSSRPRAQFGTASLCCASTRR